MRPSVTYTLGVTSATSTPPPPRSALAPVSAKPLPVEVEASPAASASPTASASESASESTSESASANAGDSGVPEPQHQGLPQRDGSEGSDTGATGLSSRTAVTAVVTACCIVAVAGIVYATNWAIRRHGAKRDEDAPLTSSLPQHTVTGSAVQSSKLVMAPPAGRIVDLGVSVTAQEGTSTRCPTSYTPVLKASSHSSGVQAGACSHRHASSSSRRSGKSRAAASTARGTVTASRTPGHAGRVHAKARDARRKRQAPPARGRLGSTHSHAEPSAQPRGDRGLDRMGRRFAPPRYYGTESFLLPRDDAVAASCSGGDASAHPVLSWVRGASVPAGQREESPWGHDAPSGAGGRADAGPAAKATPAVSQPGYVQAKWRARAASCNS